MVRAPCCEKMGLKKGPWAPEEDQLLVSFISKYGHENWRALPKQAGLLRCGKSCRLRWTNYLKPDIKRGNFSREEEETIIKLHEMLGNRWSTIAAKLPGRTDNEIKNVWHTHLKKRVVKQNQDNPETKQHSCNSNGFESPMSPQPSSSDFSSVSTMESNSSSIKDEQLDLLQNFPEIDESFWSAEAPLAAENPSCMPISDLLEINEELQPQSEFNSIEMVEPNYYGFGSNVDEGMEFWYDLFIKAGGSPEFSDVL